MPTCLDDVVVLQTGGRVAISLCGSLLAQLGAKVIAAEFTAITSDLALAMEVARDAGKLRLAVDPTDPRDLALLRAAALRADIILVSNDSSSPWAQHLPAQVDCAAIVVDVTAFGSTGPLAGRSYPDSLVQACSGLIDTTGSPDEMPIAIGVPICEFLGALHAATGAVASLRLRRRDGTKCAVEVALYDCAIETLSTFLARSLAGLSPTRVGNRHPNISPFNTYRARDGWLNLCTGNDDHWRRVCKVIGREDAALDPAFAASAVRAMEMDVIDAMIEQWTAVHTVDECMRQFLDCGIPAGPVTLVRDIATDADFVARGISQWIPDASSGAPVAVPGSVFSFSLAETRRPAGISADENDRNRIVALTSAPKARIRDPQPSPAPPLSGMLVVEIGQYTTGPRASRHLAALGAEVVKIEIPPNGDPARGYAPMKAGQSYFFHLNNSGKQSLVLDLKSKEGADDLRTVLAKADVLIENLKPGAMAKLGFGASEVLQAFPGLVYCSITGYGSASIYKSRPGMDSVLQGMAGLMDVTRSRGHPYKGGISISDICGGQLATLAIMAALEFREHDGRGQFVDVSMLDVSAWLTHLKWNDGRNAVADKLRILPCQDGYVAAIVDPQSDESVHSLCARWQMPGRTELQVVRDELVAILETIDVQAVAVTTVAETMAHDQVARRGLIAKGIAPDGQLWPYVISPIRIGGVTLPQLRAAGKLFDDQASLSARFGLSSYRVPRAAQLAG